MIPLIQKVDRPSKWDYQMHRAGSDTSIPCTSVHDRRSIVPVPTD